MSWHIDNPAGNVLWLPCIAILVLAIIALAIVDHRLRRGERESLDDEPDPPAREGKA